MTIHRILYCTAILLAMWFASELIVSLKPIDRRVFVSSEDPTTIRELNQTANELAIIRKMRNNSMDIPIRVIEINE